MKKDLTQGSVLKNIAFFSLPYLLSYFLQTLYGLADLYIVGKYNNIESITGVSIGSQFMHMLTIIIMGLAMGSTITISRNVGAKNAKGVSHAISNTVILFGIISIILTIILLILVDPIVKIMSTPVQAINQTKSYLFICFLGIPFIVSYNIISAILRGLGDSKTPMYFVSIACVLNIGLDFLFIGGFDLKASGAALGTVISQIISVIIALIYIKVKNDEIKLCQNDFKIDKSTMQSIFKVGTPIALQDGFIQLAFIFITILANMRGLEVATAVGIVEKIIGMLFLVPSAMGSTVSAICSQCLGAKKYKRAHKALNYNLVIVVIFGVFIGTLFQFIGKNVMGMFTDEQNVILLGSQYLSSYSFDCLFAGIHFCYSGYFCANYKSSISFLHNLISIILIRIPGAIWATTMHPENLFYLGLSSTLGSVLSAIICITIYFYYRKRLNVNNEKGIKKNKDF